MCRLIILSFLFIATGAGAQVFCERHKPVEPIKIEHRNNFTIKGDSINGDDVPCITLISCDNVHITNCYLGNSTKVGIYLYQCSNIIIDNVYVVNVATGVYAVDSYAINVNHCEGKNMVGPYPRGAFVQFNNVSGPRCRVNYNTFENILGQSHPEDAINMYKSHGIAKDPIQIIGNRIRGGGPSKTGGGIMLGDNGGSYQIAKENVLVDPGQYGMAISGGDHISIVNNRIYAKGRIFTNVGLYIWAQANAACSFDDVSDNQVNWTSSKGEKNNFFNPGNCGDVPGWKTNTAEVSLDESMLPRQLLSPCNK